VRVGPWVRRNGITAASASLVLAGALLWATSRWFAYAPLSDQVFLPAFSPQLALLTPQRVAGVVVGVLGLVGLAVAVGYRLGQRPYRGSKNGPL
jgi:hypothetical protein